MRELQAEMLANLMVIRDNPGVHLHPADCTIVSAAWRWARENYAPETPGNIASVRFYAREIDRIVRPLTT